MQSNSLLNECMDVSTDAHYLFLSTYGSQSIYPCKNMLCKDQPSILGLESFEMSSPNLASTASAPEGPDPSTQVANLAVAKIRIL